MITAINFSDHKFEKSRKYNTKMAYLFGKADQVIEYTPEMIDPEFLKDHQEIFQYSRGFGLWLWKPYFALKTLHTLNDGDYLMYCDAGALYINKIQHLIDALNKTEQSVMLFELPLLERQFTKKEALNLMNYEDRGENQVLATYFLIRKDTFSVAFVQEWLTYCCDERILSPHRFLREISESEGFIAHREDQSVLSVLAKKKGLELFRDPSFFGRRPWEYARDHFVYRPKKFTNSCYPTVISSNRTYHPLSVLFKNGIKSILQTIGIYNEKAYLRRIKGR